MLRRYAEYLRDCLLVANERLGDYNPLGFIERSAVELRFNKTRCKELFLVCGMPWDLEEGRATKLCG